MKLATAAEPLGYVLNIKMASYAPLHALDAPAKAFTTSDDVPSGVEPASAIRAADYRVVALDQKVLLIATWLLAMLASASIAVMVGGRMAEQTRRVGLLKASGGTPAFVGVVLLAENIMLAVAAALIGLVVSVLLSPSLASPGDGLLGIAPAPSLTITTVVIVVGVAGLVAMASTLVPAIKAARTSTFHALHDPAFVPRRRKVLVPISAALPVPLLLALRLVARRTRRTILTLASLVIAVTMVVTALTVERQLAVHEDSAAAGFSASSAIYESANHVLIVLSVALVCLAVVSVTFTAWTVVIDTQMATAVARGSAPHPVKSA